MLNCRFRWVLSYSVTALSDHIHASKGCAVQPILTDPTGDSSNVNLTGCEGESKVSFMSPAHTIRRCRCRRYIAPQRFPTAYQTSFEVFSKAKTNGYDWAWIDTTCIDKTNTTDLTEAITSHTSRRVLHVSRRRSSPARLRTARVSQSGRKSCHKARHSSSDFKPPSPLISHTLTYRSASADSTRASGLSKSCSH